jgi:hypothetical protein
MESPFQPGAIVILYLREPRERVCGMMLHLDATGVSIRGMDLASFDDWLRARVAGGEGWTASRMFYPIGRVERMLMDEGSEEVPGLDARCVALTGRSMRDHLTAQARTGVRGGGDA